MTLPAQNETTPTEPLGFAVAQQVNGTLLFSWNNPIVKPSGTRFRITRSTSDSNAIEAGTVVWEGDALYVPLVMPASRHYYWVHAVRNNSVYSPYQPNTVGIAGAARDESESARNSGAIKDWDFSLSPYFGSYWNTPATSVFSLSPTGGVVNGKLNIKPGSAQLYSVPARPYELVKARNARISMRIRCTSFAAGVNTGGGCVFAVFGWDGVNTPVQTNSNYLGGASSALANFASVCANVGKWFEFTSVGTILTDQFGSSFADVSSWPYIMGVLNLTHSNMGSGNSVFEIDFLDFRYL
jgi:hypothetical protein